jgi:alginate O-acetyltransferase complex protein AlgI
MLFNSLPFLYVFLPITYGIFWLLKEKSHRYVWLTATGYVFYSFWNYKFCALMAFSTLVAYAAGVGLLRWNDPKRRLLCVILPVTTDLLLLGFFKYANFVLGTSEHVATWLGSGVALPRMNIILPVGISFYTFHTISYVVDAYRGDIKPTKNIFEFSCYVSFFAQLVAGPIVRFRQIESDLDHIDRADRSLNLNAGWSFFTIGLAKKVIIADTIAAIIDPALAKYSGLSTLDAWLCMAGYTYQLYFDFSGYSDMAVGLGRLFGLRLPQNFNSPYKALDIADFWRRWHMSLSSCLRDYLYVPLGGNRRPPLVVARNLMMTMLLGGLWHGANWTFVVWGGYHGALLMLYRLARPRWDGLSVALRRSSTFVLVLIGWVLFRSSDFTMATALLSRMFVLHSGPAMIGRPLLFGMIASATAIAQGASNTFEMDHRWSLPASVGLVLLLGASMFIIYGTRSAPFLYFQF